jgi:hypothetical protein
MVYILAYGAYYKCSYENYRQMIRFLAAGDVFFYEDYAEPCENPTSCAVFDIGALTREDAQAIIGGF